MLLQVGGRVREGLVGRASLPRSELVADGREQGMGEVHGSPHLDHAVPLGRRERCQDVLRGAVRGCNRLRGRVPGRGRDEEDLDRLDRELGEAGAKQLPEAVRDRQRLAGLELRAAADELVAELERKSGLPPLASRTRASSSRASSRPSRDLSSRCSAPTPSGLSASRVSRPSGNARSSSSGTSTPSASRNVARTPIRSLRRRRNAI